MVGFISESQNYPPNPGGNPFSNGNISIEAPALNRASDDVGIFYVKDDFWKYDKQYHTFGSMFIGGVSYLFNRGSLKNDRSKSMINALLFTNGIGIAKELNDEFLGTTGFDMMDIGANFLGSVVGILLADWRYEVMHPSPERLAKRKARKERRKNKK